MKLDKVDFDRYSEILKKHNNNVETINMLVKQIANFTEKNKFLEGKLEMIADIIIEKYGLDKNKKYDISAEGIITEVNPK